MPKPNFTDPCRGSVKKYIDQPACTRLKQLVERDVYFCYPEGIKAINRMCDLLSQWLELLPEPCITKCKVYFQLDNSFLKEGVALEKQVAVIFKTDNFGKRDRRLWVSSAGLCDSSGTILLHFKDLRRVPSRIDKDDCEDAVISQQPRQTSGSLTKYPAPSAIVAPALPDIQDIEDEFDCDDDEL
eukprot:TRINITY_DN66794_c0_g1_i1.p1 TRINITY_DN66794_c0_g1~~TRINITY_DN66794_c0_g1_i1.p1  ORF type:complete len:185 (+),score=37.90 TRINITY_DN66794_c0_g1_i1:91-645(+)